MKKSIVLRGCALLWAVVLATPAAAETNCYAPAWQRFADPKLGVTVEVSTDTHVSYWLNDQWLENEKLVGVTVGERGRPGEKIAARCSSFDFDVLDLGSNEISNAAGLLKAQADSLTDGGLNGFKLVRNRTLTFQGLPAREIVYSFTIDYFHTRATHRYLLVARGNRFYSFRWVWGDGGDTPADSARIYESVRFTAPAADPNARSRAMLESTILLYWLRKDYPQTVYMSPALRKIADPKRAAESKIVDGYGYVQAVAYRGVESGYRVFRVEHSKAVVDWYVVDDGNQITALTWKKVRDIKQ